MDARHDAPPEGFRLPYDRRRKEQQEEKLAMLKRYPKWKAPSYEPDDSQGAADASLGGDPDSLAWDCQRNSIDFQMETADLHIEDDIEQEPPRVELKPPVDCKDVQDVGADKEYTPMNKRKAEAFVDPMTGRLYADGKKQRP